MACDDDNSNGTADKDDAGPTLGENDLKPLSVILEPGWEGSVTLTVTPATGLLRFYENPDRSGAFPLPHTWTDPATELPKILHVEGLAPSTAVLTATLSGQGALEIADSVAATVIGADLDGDADHDGVIDAQGADDTQEETLPGVIVLCNQDDDDTDQVVDNLDNVVNDGGDAADLAQIVVRQMPGIPANFEVRLTLQNPSNVATGINAGKVVRVSPDNAPNTPAVLGPGTLTFTFEPDASAHDADLVGLRAGDVTLWVEGLEFAAEVKLLLEVRDDLGALVCDDRIQLKVAPFVMLPNTAVPSRVLVADMDAAFHASITSLVGAASVITTTVNDQWPQDAWEFGLNSAPFGSMPVTFETLRENEPLEAWGRTNLLGPVPSDPNRTGLSHRLAGVNDQLAYGGNLEVTPPLSDAPLGRIVVGATMPQVQKDFLTRQGVQSPLIELDTSWLKVGHVDEFMSFIPAPATGGWDVVWASPTEAIAQLSDAAPFEPLFYCDVNDIVITGKATGGTDDTLIDTTANFASEPFFRYIRIYEGTGKGQIAEIDPTGLTTTSIRVSYVWLFDKMVNYWNAVQNGTGVTPAASWVIPLDDTSRYILVPCSKIWTWTDDGVEPPETLAFPALVTAGEIVADTAYLSDNVIPSRDTIGIAASTHPIPSWLLNNPVTFLNVPALFMGDSTLPGSRWALALAPGMVNMQVWATPLQTDLWIPKPFGPRNTVAFPGSPRYDLFQAEADQVLTNGRTIVFIDDWDTYHRSHGEVHCGTNVIRVAPDGYTQWWEQQP